jgi:hypothetical protein
MHMKARGTWLLVSMFWLASGGAAQAADIQELVRETQRNTSTEGRITLVWWMPVQFWEESLKSNPAIPEAARAQVIGALADYHVIALLRAEAGIAGLTGVQPKAELLKNSSVTFDGRVIEPLAPEQVSPAAQLLLSQLKPGMAAMIGQMGQSLEFVVYPASLDGKPVMNPLLPGNLQVKLYDQTFQWRLPLGSLLPPRRDPKSGEQFPGNYLFNPFTGEKLAAP